MWVTHGMSARYNVMKLRDTSPLGIMLYNNKTKINLSTVNLPSYLLPTLKELHIREMELERQRTKDEAEKKRKDLFLVKLDFMVKRCRLPILVTERWARS